MIDISAVPDGDNQHNKGVVLNAAYCTEIAGLRSGNLQAHPPFEILLGVFTNGWRRACGRHNTQFDDRQS